MIDQITAVLSNMRDEEYAAPLDIFNGSSIGQHFRHILNFYQCVLKGVEDHVVDYSKRVRDAQAECDTCYTQEAFAAISSAVGTLQEEAAIAVKADFSADQSLGRPMVQSSIGRELMFAYDHAVHHLAIIKIGLRVVCPHLELDERVGVAPATLKYHGR